jgi:hypothetical protein
MKNLIYSGLFLALLGIVFVGCEQEDNVTPNDSITANNFSSKSDTNEKSSSMRIFMMILDEPECLSAGGTCLNTIVINGLQRSDMNDFIVIIETGNQILIQSEFLNNTTFIETFVPSNLITDVTNSDLTVEIISDSEHDYLKFIDGNNAIENVIPIEK